MSYQDFMSKVRYLDNQMSKWIIRHFYILFFEALLIVIFVVLFVITIKVIDVSAFLPKKNLSGRLLLLQTVNSIIIVLLLLLNSFWMLYVFNAITRIRSLLREMNFNLIKRKN